MAVQWLWLEDELATVSDFKAVVEQVARVRMFQRIPEMVRYLLENRQSLEAGETPIGLILDVMIQGAHGLIRPKTWFGGASEAVFYSNHGFEAGLIFYEKFIIGDGPVPLFNPLPPVIFLTVMHGDSAVLERRLDRIREQWAKANGTSLDGARVQFVRKWDIDGQKLLKILKSWEVVSK